ncbi:MULTISPECIES: hypothetical protein [Rhodococcus erythropolis group]|uniref:hypothetical protein n=1 Tax=Rhodococcus erythropolis group TaxID=2840174 RepID=UPI0005A75F59|nr:MULTISPECIES: hypothetical protein [Rhodococcus erythropolis group]QXC46718.1 hypothetical protein KSE96_32065 [Rhodococcus qingshengii]
MSIIIITAALALAALLIWTLGAPVARIGGALLTIASLLCIVFGDSIAARAPLLIGGMALWLAGHFLTAYKTRVWSSRLAENIVTRTPLRYLDPVSGHEHRQMRRTTTGGESEPSAGRIQAPVDDFAQWERELAADTVPASTGRPVAKRVPARAAAPSRRAVYGTRAAKAATNLAVRTVPGARAVRSVWRFVR